MIKLFIPIICYNHTCNTNYMLSLINLIFFLNKNNIQTTIYPICFDSLIQRARNAAIAEFMSNTDNTHILFIDADIEFKIDDVVKMINANKPVICAGYPQKWLNINKINAIFKRDNMPINPLELCTNHSVHLIKEQPISELMKVEYCTTGFLLIERNVIEKLINSYPERKYINDIDGYSSSNKDLFYNLFTVEINKNSLRLESEDYGFSRLWRDINGDIFVLTNISLIHHGWFGYQNNIYRELMLDKY
jgi:hypothetical protein